MVHAVLRKPKRLQIQNALRRKPRKAQQRSNLVNKGLTFRVSLLFCPVNNPENGSLSADFTDKDNDINDTGT